jgi:hypothetical protein
MIRKWLFRTGAACVLVAFAVTNLPTVHADEIDPLLAKDAAALMKLFRTRGYKNIGVLKFEVQRGGPNGPVSMANGSLNSMMATRLENAFILANDNNPIGITRNASEVAARADKNAGYHTKAAREKLFEQNFPLAWGTNSVKVDAFVTGRVTVSPDYKTSTVLVRLFDKNDAKMIDAARFTAPVDRSLIVDMGQPFAVSKAIIAKRALLISPNPGTDPGTPVTATEDMVLEDVQKSAESADKGNKGLQPVEALDPVVPVAPVRPNPIVPAANTQKVRLEAPLPGLARAKAELDSVVKFDVYYNGQLVTWTADNRLPAPQANDQIEFHVRSTERIGMILRVNGVNTADYDRSEKDINDYTKWVLEPNKDFTIRGFYPSADKVVLFTAAARDEVDASELGNERRIGKIDLEIFREAPKAAAAPKNPIADPEISTRKMDLRGTETGTNSAEVAGKLRKLASRKMSVTKGRTLIVGGDVEQAEVKTTTFVGVHAIHMPITYFDPRAQQPTFLQPENE